MLQFHAELCCIESNVAHLSACDHAQAGKVRRYIQLFVASELASDVEELILAKTPLASTSNKLIRLRQISAFLPTAQLWGIQQRPFIKKRNTVNCKMQRLLVQCHLKRCAKQACLPLPTSSTTRSSLSSCDPFVPACPSDADRSFVVRHFYASVSSAFNPFSLVTDSL